jgi:leader peptidase (prepilin peptidase)/N-methyltransferase
MGMPATESDFGVPLSIAIGFMAVLGAMIGSFLNVVIHRLPREQSIVLPKSACPACGAAIRFYDNIPILSFLILRGRCRSCHRPISARYPAVEALCALLFALVTWRDGLSFALPFDIAFAASMLTLVFIDSEHMILPNAITYPGIIFAVTTRVAVPYLGGASHFDDLPYLVSVFPGYPVPIVSLIGAAIGALAGGGSLWLMGFLWKKLRGIEAMGMGDVKMMLMVGAFLGWRLAGLTIFIGVFSGSLAGIALMFRRGRRNLQMMLPFGIFLGIGAVVSLLVGTRIVEWYGSQFR